MAVKIVVADVSHVQHAESICELIHLSAQQRGTGIANRTPEYIAQKMSQGKAIIALNEQSAIGFSYIETWSHGMFVANSGLVVAHEYRNTGLARKIKKQVFELSRKLYPKAKIFSITTGLAVMKLNSELGYVPVTFSELTRDIEFWKGCEGCKNYDILLRNDYKMCLCTGLMFDPSKQKEHRKGTLPVVPQMLPWRFFPLRPGTFIRRMFQRQRLLHKRAVLRRKKQQKQNNRTSPHYE